MPGYLLDTNHVSAWEERDARFLARMRAVPPENIIWVCPITLGEIESGLRITASTDAARRHACRSFINREVLIFVQQITDSTREDYALVMERIYAKYRPANAGVRTQAHLSEHGVDVNDVWIAAVALEHNLTLLTADQMKTIRECVPELKVENWLV